MVESDVTRSRSRDRKIETFVTRIVTCDVNVTKDVITSISLYDCRSDLCVFLHFRLNTDATETQQLIPFLLLPTYMQQSTR